MFYIGSTSTRFCCGWRLFIHAYSSTDFGDFVSARYGIHKKLKELSSIEGRFLISKALKSNLKSVKNFESVRNWKDFNGKGILSVACRVAGFHNESADDNHFIWLVFMTMNAHKFCEMALFSVGLGFLPSKIYSISTEDVEIFGSSPPQAFFPSLNVFHAWKQFWK